jgi:selenocysteine-specific translation elongation factor
MKPYNPTVCTCIIRLLHATANFMQLVIRNWANFQLHVSMQPETNCIRQLQNAKFLVVSKGLSIGDLGLVTLNVKDGVCCLSSRNYVSGESEASPNIDINVFTKTLILEIKHIYLYIFIFLSTTYNIFIYIKSLKV